MNCTCFFCEENRFCLNKELMLPSDDSILFEDDNIYVTPDLFPLCLGHILIITKNHYSSFGNAPYSIYESAERAKGYLVDKIFKSTPYIVFEHGAVMTHTGGSCIDHAHIHIMPLNTDIKDKIEESVFIDSNAIKADYTNLNRLATQGIPYIYYQRNAELPVAYPIYNGLPSQFFRIIIANILNVNYNWKELYRDGTAKEVFCKTVALGDENIGEII